MSGAARHLRSAHRVAAHAAGAGVLAALAWFYFFGELAIPERWVMLRSGTFGLVFLVASFACSPLSRLLRFPALVQVRRALGLYGFALVAVHLLTYAALESGFSLELIWRDLGERRAMLVGMAAFAALVPLALTSTRGWQKRLGRRWKILHRLVYVALPLSVLHFLLLDRDIQTVPWLFAAAVALLLLLRVQPRRSAEREPSRAESQTGRV